MNYDEMKAELEQKNQVYGAIRQKAFAHVKAVYEKYTAQCSGVSLRMREGNSEYAEVVAVDEENKRSCDFNLYFHERWHEPRRFELNIGTCGSFNCDNMVQVNLYIAAGVFAKNMKEIEAELLSFDWKAYDAAAQAAGEARWAIDDYERNERKRLEEQKKLDIASKIIVGTKIVTGKHWSTKEPIVEEIDWMTDKNVTFKSSYGRRTKKDIVVANLMRGEWQFA